MTTKFKIHFQKLNKDYLVKINKPENTDISIFLGHYIFYKELTPKNQSLFLHQLRETGGNTILYPREQEIFDSIKVLSIDEIKQEENKVFSTK